LRVKLAAKPIPLDLAAAAADDGELGEAPPAAPPKRKA